MKKLLLFLFPIVILFSCNDNLKTSKNSEKLLIFKDLDSINAKSKEEIQNYLKLSDYTFLNNQAKSVQWKSKKDKNIIQFNGEGVLLILTYDENFYKKLISELKETDYKNSGMSIKNNVEVESYSKDKETIFLSSMSDENGQKIYSLTFIN